MTRPRRFQKEHHHGRAQQKGLHPRRWRHRRSGHRGRDGPRGGKCRLEVPDRSDDGTPAPEGSVVAFVKDAKAGSITVMRGEREVQITDKALARKLAKLTQL